MSVMNIVDSANTNYCDDKCSLSFNYPASSTCVATNYGSMFSFSYNIDPTLTPVTFSNSNYNVDQIQLASPSIHLFNGSTAEAELIIIHNESANPNNKLYICIPISSTSNNPSQLLSNILNDVVDYTMNTQGDQQTFYIQNYNLNSIIPYNPYFYYQQESNGSTINFVVYGIQYAINISATILNDISSYIVANSNPEDIFPYESNLFFNQTGPGVTDSGEIYIDCQPINSSTETVEVAFKKQTSPVSGSSTGSNNEITKWLNSLGFGPTTVVIMMVMLLIGVVYIFLGKTNLLNNTKIKGSGSSKTIGNNILNERFTRSLGQGGIIRNSFLDFIK